MTPVEIYLEDGALEEIRGHLLPRGGICEEAVFLFAHPSIESDSLVLSAFGTTPIPPNGFAHRSLFYLELTDETRAEVIKRAHDLGAGLIECHSHPGQRRACFSWSDLHGFDEFVPHVRWRLQGRPYAAMVFATDSVDALAWHGERSEAVGVRCIRAGGVTVEPTGLTVVNWRDLYDRESL